MEAVQSSQNIHTLYNKDWAIKMRLFSNYVGHKCLYHDSRTDRPAGSVSFHPTRLSRSSNPRYIFASYHK